MLTRKIALAAGLFGLFLTSSASAQSQCIATFDQNTPQSEVRKRMACLAGENDALQKRVDAANASAAAATRKLETVSSENSTLRKQVDARGGDDEALRQLRGENATLRKQAEAAQASAASATQRIESLRSESATLRKQLDARGGDDETLRQLRGENATLRKQAEATQASAASATQRIESLRSESATLRKQLDARGTDDDTLRQLRSDNASLRKQLEASRTDLQTARASATSVPTHIAPAMVSGWGQGDPIAGRTNACMTAALDYAKQVGAAIVDKNEEGVNFFLGTEHYVVGCPRRVASAFVAVAGFKPVKELDALRAAILERANKW